MFYTVDEFFFLEEEKYDTDEVEVSKTICIKHDRFGVKG